MMTTKPVTYIFSKNRLTGFADALAGNEPTEFFYGAVELTQAGLNIQVIEAPTDIEPHWPAAALNFIGPNGPVKLDGCVMQATYNHLALIRKSAAVVGTTGAHAFALALLKKLHFHKTPIIGIQCGLLNHPINFSRRMTTSSLMKAMENILYGEGELNLMRTTYPGCEKHLSVNQFGVDTSFWVPRETTSEDYILSIGNDSCRDYEILMDAARQINSKFVVITNQDLNDPPSNVEHIKGSLTKGLSNRELRELYRNASMVVVPLKETYQPSGQSVTLQAMACGKSVILSATKGLWCPKTLINNETVVLTPPQDTNSLIKKIELLIADKKKRQSIGAAARNVVKIHGNISSFSKRLKECMNER